MGKAFDRVCGAFRDNGLTVIEKGGDRADAQAPGHSGADRSVSIRSIEDRVLVNCHEGEQLDDVLAAVGLQMRDLFDSPKGATYNYPDGRRVHRSPDKKFTQCGNTKGRSLFRSDRVASAETIYVVEGEQDVLAIESAGGTAVCSAMGAGCAHHADWEPLRGKSVVIVADRDEPGREHAAKVAEILRGVARSVRIVEAAVGKDAADHIAAGRTLNEFVYEEIDGAALLDEIELMAGRYLAPVPALPDGRRVVDRPHVGALGVLRDTAVGTRLTRAGQRQDPGARGSGPAVPGRQAHSFHDDRGVVPANRRRGQATADDPAG